MSAENDTLSADKLREPDPAIWARVQAEVLPAVLKALQRIFGPGRRWLDLEGVVHSAQRTAFRRIQEHADPNLEDLETFESLCRWLIGTAYNKVLVTLRSMGVEEKHAPRIAQIQDQAEGTLLDTLAHETATQIVARIQASLADPTAQAIFDGKYAERTEIQIGNELGRSKRFVRGHWQQLRNHLRQTESETSS